MAAEQDMARIASEYVKQVLDDQRRLGYRAKLSKEARAAAVKDATGALTELSLGATAGVSRALER
jgi:hypothetical protein